MGYVNAILETKDQKEAEDTSRQMRDCYNKTYYVMRRKTKLTGTLYRVIEFVDKDAHEKEGWTLDSAAQSTRVVRVGYDE